MSEFQTIPATRCEWCGYVALEGDEDFHAEDCDGGEEQLVDFEERGRIRTR